MKKKKTTRSPRRTTGIVKAPAVSEFAREVLRVVSRIPRGKVLTYAEVARRAGHPGAARAVGSVLNRWNYKITGVPCHRVVRSDGTAGGYIDGEKKKIALLKREVAFGRG